MIRMEQKNITGPMDRVEAQAITDRIRNGLDNLSQLVAEAHGRQAWKAMGYKTWEAYVQAEFDMTRRTSYRLLTHAEVAKELEEFVPTAAQISQRDAEIIKAAPETKVEIKERVEAGQEPVQAVKETVDAAREAKAKEKAERKAQQAEHDRQRDEARAALPDAIKQREQAKAQAITARQKPALPENPSPDGLSHEDRIDELEEVVRVLEAENADLKAENKLYGEMKVQFVQGGFDKVVAGKDEEIRVLQTRLYQESGDKASWMKAAKYWQAEAKKLGWSNGDFTVDIETGEIADA